jgi:hypothetical protein
MAFRKGQGEAAAEFLRSRGFAAPASAGQRLRQANAALNFEARGVAYTKEMLRGHWKTPEHPGRRPPRNIPAPYTPRERSPRYARQAENGVWRAPVGRYKRDARAAVRELAPHAETRGIHIVVRRQNGEWLTLTPPGGMTPGGIERLLGDFRLWRSALRDLLAGRYGKGATEGDDDVDMDSAELVIF